MLYIEKASDDVIAKVLEKTRLSFNDISHIVSTGYGRHSITYSEKGISEIICHAKGVYFLLPKTQIIIDIGCQDSKIIWLDKNGNVSNFVMNDKCAAGTGRFLEVMSQALGLDIDDLGIESKKEINPCHISSTCTVFAESEVITLRATGARRSDIIAGIHHAIAKRVIRMATGPTSGSVVFTGGVAKNSGVKSALEKQLGVQITIPPRPQLTGALGAALIAYEID